jgi:hypothetical protein
LFKQKTGTTPLKFRNLNWIRNLINAKSQSFLTGFSY